MDKNTLIKEMFKHYFLYLECTFILNQLFIAIVRKHMEHLKKKFADSFEQIIMVINNIDWSNFDKNND